MQPPVTTGGTNQNFIEPFDTIYNGASTYPAKRAEIVADYINMGYHLVTIWTYPIEFDPISKKFSLAASISPSITKLKHKQEQSHWHRVLIERR